MDVEARRMPRPTEVPCRKCHAPIQVGSRGRLPTICLPCRGGLVERPTEVPCQGCGSPLPVPPRRGPLPTKCQPCRMRRTAERRRAAHLARTPEQAAARRERWTARNRRVSDERAARRAGMTCSWCSGPVQAKRLGDIIYCGPTCREKARYARTGSRKPPRSEWSVERLMAEREYDRLRGPRKNAARRAVYEAGDLTADEWAAILDAHDFRCYVCAAPAEHLDHVVPIARGGQHTAANVRPACSACNLSKGDRLLEEWLPDRLAELAA